MGRFHGKVGYSTRVETAPDIWKDIIEERTFYGTVKSLNTGWNSQSNSLEDDNTVNVQISINVDKDSYEHFDNIKWIQYMGAKRRIRSATPKRPCIVVTLGGLWNENET